MLAPLRNELLARRLMDHLVNRAPALPGIGVIYGPSGYGKSCAVAGVVSSYRAVYVQCRSYLTKRSLLETILDEIGVRPGRTVHEMVNQICEQLAHGGRPLILDEANHLVTRNLVELALDIYEGAGTPLVMVGEEWLPRKLKRWERVHNRVLEWMAAEPTDLPDAQKLAKLYAPDVPIGDDLLEQIVKQTKGVTRRVCVNIEGVRQEAKKAGVSKVVDLKTWGSRALFTGEAPARRVA